MVEQIRNMLALSIQDILEEVQAKHLNKLQMITMIDIRLAWWCHCSSDIIN